ncbi:UPF0488 protein C8orf33 homolog [Spea bombifrons]|uniref:UPF0488 protein C8orf33 homolog n=1 Tax=Spea bombifrons TaxID=233779 RepID=UPI00234AE976|nr:UPF0488 protein C8orf33 homolog [Spea bombifrons]XP_053328131.1 UPF0488 protein C8orf33 homolog [Spea bombifrons]
MEEAPKGTFEDELEWCIQQLEKGLLRRNPTPKQVSEAQRVLQVLRSRKAPFVKKRQMMNQVFGNYRLKMAEERKAEEKAATNSSDAQIQEGASQDSHSVSYRKCSKDTPGGSGSWFPASNNSFKFNFCPDEKVPSTDGGSVDSEKNPNELIKANDVEQGRVMDSGEKSGFSFNFQIPCDMEAPSQSSDCQGRGCVQETSGPLAVGSSSPEETQTVSEPERSQQSDKKSEVPTKTLTQDVSEKIPGDSPKKKKKKASRGKGPTGGGGPKDNNKAAGTQSETVKNVPPRDESQTAEEELRRELDWCIEQLEIGLQRQKSTPKQVEEATRAIKTLRSEKAALVKKRQVMRAMFGDYRSKMEQEKQKQLRLMQIAAQSARVSEVTGVARRKSSKVFRRSINKTLRTPRAHHAGSPAPRVSNSEPADPGTPSQRVFVLALLNEPFCFNFQV